MGLVFDITAIDGTKKDGLTPEATAPTTRSGLKIKIMIWTSVKDKLPVDNQPVLTKCPKMGKDGGTVILIARLMDESKNDWYSGFPYDQPVYPTHWCYSIEVSDDI